MVFFGVAVVQRSPILGYNHNIRHRGLVFHVQTEDSGVSNPHIFTHMFHGGVILETRKLDYDPTQDQGAVKSLMQAQHKAVLKELLKGLFDEKITQYLGDNPELEPPLGAGGALGPPEASPATASPSDEIGLEIEGEGEWAVPTVTFSKPRTPTERAIAATTAGVPQTRVPLPTSPSLPAVPPLAPQEEPARVHSPAPSSAPEVPGSTASRVGTYSQHRASSSHRIVTRPVAEAPTQPVTSTRSRSASSSRRTAVPRGTESAGRRRRRSSASNVVVSRPAVIVGAPPKIVGGRGSSGAAGSRPARTRKAREEPGVEGLFGQDLISEKSLDEVILAYLSEDGKK